MRLAFIWNASQHPTNNVFVSQLKKKESSRAEWEAKYVQKKMTLHKMKVDLAATKDQLKRKEIEIGIKEKISTSENQQWQKTLE